MWFLSSNIFETSKQLEHRNFSSDKETLSFLFLTLIVIQLKDHSTDFCFILFYQERKKTCLSCVCRLKTAREKRKLNVLFVHSHKLDMTLFYFIRTFRFRNHTSKFDNRWTRISVIRNFQVLVKRLLKKILITGWDFKSQLNRKLLIAFTTICLKQSSAGRGNSEAFQHKFLFFFYLDKGELGELKNFELYSAFE